jgi:hypothetical protein
VGVLVGRGRREGGWEGVGDIVGVWKAKMAGMALVGGFMEYGDHAAGEVVFALGLEFFDS